MGWEIVDGKLTFVPDGGGGDDEGGSPLIRNINGEPHERGADGRWYPVQVGMTASKWFDPGARTPIPGSTSAAARSVYGSGGGGGSGNALGFANLAENRRQFDLEFGEERRQFEESLALERAALDQRIAEAERDWQAELLNMEFLRDKLRVETEAGDKDRAERTQARTIGGLAAVVEGAEDPARWAAGVTKPFDRAKRAA